jgi:murein DD-endopeptidase MepM/ murein hydrolase activator NlpD
MRKGVLAGACFAFALLAQTRGQQVEIPRDAPRQIVDGPALSAVEDEQTDIAAERLPTAIHYNKPGEPKITAEHMRKAGAKAREKVEKESQLEASHFAEPPSSLTKRSNAPVRPLQDRQPSISEPALSQSINVQTETAFTKLANGFDFPVGKPDAQGYYKARGFHSHGHLGEDWDGIRGGDTDLGDAIYSTADGVVVFARDCHLGWGNVVIVRHAFREDGMVKNLDSLYGHLDRILVRRGQSVSRGEKIATMGTAHGIYDAHLHFEIRKNLAIGMSRAAFARDMSNYYDPTQFILSHRQLPTSKGNYRIALNTFAHDANIRWSDRRNYSHSNGSGTSESAAALKRAVAAQQ